MPNCGGLCSRNPRPSKKIDPLNRKLYHADMLYLTGLCGRDDGYPTQLANMR